MDEGYIKFNCNWVKEKPINPVLLREINNWRDKLYKLGLIGVYDNGIGFGNISIRFKNHKFIITGSATGSFKNLTKEHYTLVDDYNIAKNSLTCKGPIIASSESLSHAVIYECSPDTNAVIHIHSLHLWEKHINRVPTTQKSIPYGTPEMANEIKRLFRESNVSEKKLIVMGGHEEGLICFGETLYKASTILLNMEK